MYGYLSVDQPLYILFFGLPPFISLSLVCLRKRPLAGSSFLCGAVASPSQACLRMHHRVDTGDDRT